MKVYSIENGVIPKRSLVSVGVFDGVHIGHKAILKSLLHYSELMGVPPLVITFRDHPRIVLKKVDADFSLLNTREERYALLAEQGIEACLEVAFDEEMATMSALSFVKAILRDRIGFSGIILGYDNHFGNTEKGHFEEVYTYSQEAKFFIKREPAVFCHSLCVSSSQVRKALLKGDIQLANSMLGYHYFFSGMVVEGNQLGRSIAFPTANIANIDPYKLLPALGVYVVNVVVDQTLYRGMMNIGNNPSIPGKPASIEVHLINFEGNLYAKGIKVELLGKLRDERYFESLELLRQQLEIDKAQSVTYPSLYPTKLFLS